MPIPFPDSPSNRLDSAPAANPRLAAARVFILGAGGLGAPVALFLAQTGIGHLVIADGDRVELSNLHRQILHVTPGVGLPKAESARQTLQRSHPATRVTPIHLRITETTIANAVTGCDLVVDGSDNFEARYLLNRICMTRRIPLVSGAVLGFEGQVATFRHGVDPEAPCYQCLHPGIKQHGCGPESPIPTCATAGVLGPVAGVIGALQATEAIQTLLNRQPSPANGSIWLINLRDQFWLRVAIPKNPACPVCAAPQAGPVSRPAS
ncbi:MAG: HesA/MoeB/ThiF family protein [Magnetococcales bacterium]|nr:HesA/MoeB/ThiF family protein [Magnetococcales bacterium]